MKSTVIITLLVLPSIWFASALQPNPQPDNPEPVPLNFTPAQNVTIGPRTVWAAWPTCEILFYPEAGKAVIEKDGEQATVYGNVFQPAAGEILLVRGTEYIRLNMATGLATTFLNGKMEVY